VKPRVGTWPALGSEFLLLLTDDAGCLLNKVNHVDCLADPSVQYDVLDGTPDPDVLLPFAQFEREVSTLASVRILLCL
jgi:hypothetical protein